MGPAVCDSSPLLVRACRGEFTERAPVWIMRQAGRYLPEYRAVRARASFIEVCMKPELAAEVTLQPVRRLGVDAAIIFYDILLPLRAMGAAFEFDDKPRLERPIRSRAEAEAIHRPEGGEAFAALQEALRRVRGELSPETALIGFSGAPFTLADYLIEGGASVEHAETKRLLAADPEAAHALLERLAEGMIDCLRGQAEAGAQVLQIFESSGGVLGPRDYAEFALPYARKVIEGARATGAPVIFFPRGCGGYLELFADCGADVIGIDWQTAIGTADERLKGVLFGRRVHQIVRESLQLPRGDPRRGELWKALRTEWSPPGGRMGIQGNLDPAALLGSKELIERKVREILEDVGDQPRFVFNLGHGILPQTPPENAEAMVAAVKRLSAAKRGR